MKTCDDCGDLVDGLNRLCEFCHGVRDDLSDMDDYVYNESCDAIENDNLKEEKS